MRYAIISIGCPATMGQQLNDHIMENHFTQKHGPSGSGCQHNGILPFLERNRKARADAATLLLLTVEPELSREISGMLESKGYRHEIIRNPHELWKKGRLSSPACLLCSHSLQDGVTGFHFLEGIEQRCWSLPTILIDSQWDVPHVVKAMKSGAENLLSLPMQENILLDAVEQGLLRANQQWEQACAIADAKDCAATLDRRELQVVKHVLRGYLNKEIADQLDLALVTIKVYRARAVKKLRAGNPAELARIASLAGLCDEMLPARAV